MAAAPVSAAQAIGEYLQSPDDLVKVSAYRKKLEKEKASIDARLKNGVKEQLQATREGLRKLMATRANVQAIKDEMIVIDRECSDPQTQIATFDQISRVSMVHRNFVQTEEMVNNLIEMESKLSEISYMLDDDSAYITGPASNLLVIHYYLNQLEAFRNQTMHQAKKASGDARINLTRRFERLHTVLEQFDQYIVDLASNVLDIVREGNSHVIVRLIKIAEMEGREDEKAIAIRLVKKAAKLDAASKFKSMQANARVIKHYRSKITKAIADSIKAKFNWEYKNAENDPMAFIKGLQWMYQDIIRIQSDVVQCFPPEYDIYSLYIREYHKALNAQINKIVTSEPGASVLLALFDWLKEYKSSMKELDVPPDLLQPPLLDGKEQILIEDYLQVIIKKLDEWSSNMMKTELEEFVSRRDPLEVDADGQYATQGGAGILFQMVNQQIDLAAESGQGAILTRVVAESNRVMRGMQDQWAKAVEQEYKKQVEPNKNEEVAAGLVEYVMALANDMLKSADYAEALLARLEPLVHEKYQVQMNEKLNEAIDGYLDVAKKCTQTLIDLIFNDVKTATKSLFQANWYTEPILAQIIATMGDYMGDYKEYLNASLFELLVEDLVDAFLLLYLNALANSPKLKMPAAPDRIKNDADEAFKFFTEYKSQKEMEEYFDVLDLILGILEASKDLVFLSYWSFAKKHGPNLAFIEGLLKARGDLDRSQVSEVMDTIKRKVKDENLADPPEPTIMKKVAIQNAFSRFLRT
ncbi:exocyst complex component Sec6-domain-containing protein [Rhodocollybia butyracea]|uniref:Exocyst complex component Sec6-domain-containing protein n=1 Tax=Rhodocollybia butyracea TaxID=206335 RepID=A0A9P5Q9N5_9AGAR|nr:exocyst complex component Sec6-domain-containing protein [Rhodocollybia butyracea]